MPGQPRMLLRASGAFEVGRVLLALKGAAPPCCTEQGHTWTPPPSSGRGGTPLVTLQQTRIDWLLGVGRRVGWCVIRCEWYLQHAPDLRPLGGAEVLARPDVFCDGGEVHAAVLHGVETAAGNRHTSAGGQPGWALSCEPWNGRCVSDFHLRGAARPASGSRGCPDTDPATTLSLSRRTQCHSPFRGPTAMTTQT